ncbi:glycosyltransferase [Novipirellula sp. SH528]|uniref:glycosyltransferase n=1 Tax=Novipirellula sp. SH528 TaxID=3454466 RepID=UPI003F9F42CE
MRALLVLPEPPNNFGGAAARWYHVLLNGLIDRSAEVVVLACSGGREPDREARKTFGEHCDIQFYEASRKSKWGKLNAIARPYSASYSSEMTKQVENYCAQPFDTIRFETHFSAWATNKPPKHAELNVHQLHCIDRALDCPASLSQWLMRSRVLSAERILLKRFSRVSALTDRLAMAVKKIHPTADIRVTPMTLDPELYEFQPRKPCNPAHPTVGLIGTFNWGPTLSAGKTLVEEIWPRILAERPGARLMLVGRGVDGAFGYLASSPGVEVRSDVPDTIPYFRQLDTMVYLPEIGSGMKVKVMEAIALGTPVITNREGAEGLPLSVADGITVNGIHEVVSRFIGNVDNADTGQRSERLRAALFDELSPSRCIDSTVSGLQSQSAVGTC